VTIRTSHYTLFYLFKNPVPGVIRIDHYRYVRLPALLIPLVVKLQHDRVCFLTVNARMSFQIIKQPLPFIYPQTSQPYSVLFFISLKILCLRFPMTNLAIIRISIRLASVLTKLSQLFFLFTGRANLGGQRWIILMVCLNAS
jgi:hypothetical protein